MLLFHLVVFRQTSGSMHTRRQTYTENPKNPPNSELTALSPGLMPG